MAKSCVIRRQDKRLKLTQKYSELRKNLKKIIYSQYASDDDREFAFKKLQKLPKDSIKCRLRNRCWKTGKAHGVYRKVGLCRNMFRYYAMRGDIPGIRKASW